MKLKYPMGGWLTQWPLGRLIKSSFVFPAEYLSDTSVLGTFQQLNMQDLGCAFDSPKYELEISDGDLNYSKLWRQLSPPFVCCILRAVVFATGVSAAMKATLDLGGMAYLRQLVCS